MGGAEGAAGRRGSVWELSVEARGRRLAFPPRWTPRDIDARTFSSSLWSLGQPLVFVPGTDGLYVASMMCPWLGRGTQVESFLPSFLCPRAPSGIRGPSNETDLARNPPRPPSPGHPTRAMLGTLGSTWGELQVDGEDRQRWEEVPRTEGCCVGGNLLSPLQHCLLEGRLGSFHPSSSPVPGARRSPTLPL